MDSDTNPYKCNHCTEKFSDIKMAQTHFFNNHVNNVVKTEEIQQLESTIKIEKSSDTNSPVKSEQNEDLNVLKIKQESVKEVTETDRVNQIKNKFLAQVESKPKYEEKNYMCPFCTAVKILPSKFDLTEHCSQVHEGKKIYFCLLCEACFGCKVTLSNHMTIATVRKKLFKVKKWRTGIVLSKLRSKSVNLKSFLRTLRISPRLRTS